MHIKLEEAIEGCVLAEDIVLESQRLFMSKGTVLTNQLLGVLQKFLISFIEIEKQMVDGKLFKTSSTNEKRQSITISYEECFKGMSKLYHNVAAGLPLQFSDIQPVMAMLIEFIKNRRLHADSYSEILFTNHCLAESAMKQALLSFQIGEKLKLEYHDCIQLLYAGALCSVGLAKMDHGINTKEGIFVSEKERDEYKKHPIISYSLISKIDFFRSEIKLAILQHQEMIDGSGYPYKLKENKIHLYSQIIGISKMYVSLVSNQKNNKMFSYAGIIDSINELKYKKYNFKVVEAILAVIFPIHNNSMVLLSDGTKGRIIYIDSQNLLNILVERNEEVMAITKSSAIQIVKVL